MAYKQEKLDPTRLTALMALTFGVVLLSAGCGRPVETARVAATPAPVGVPAPVVPPPVTATGALPATAGADVKVADIASNWTNYSGKTVTVVADVEEVKGARAFTLDEDSVLLPALF